LQLRRMLRLGELTMKQPPLFPFKPMTDEWERLEKDFEFNTDKKYIAAMMQTMIDYVLKTTKSRQKRAVNVQYL